jgi:hypothetical protein
LDKEVMAEVDVAMDEAKARGTGKLHDRLHALHALVCI